MDRLSVACRGECAFPSVIEAFAWLLPGGCVSGMNSPSAPGLLPAPEPADHCWLAESNG